MTIVNDIIKPLFQPFYVPVLRMIQHFNVDYRTKHVLEQKWLAFTGTPIDWDNPQTLNEKIQWLIAFSDTTEWSRLADKILVRDYVKDKGLEDILIPLIGTWKDACNIDFDALPDKCVLKCNHDSASTIILDKAKGYDKQSIIRELNEKLKKKFGYRHCEPHYNSIKPRILCEEFLDSDTEELSTSPIDYKVFCYNGEPDVINVYYNRTEDSVIVETWDKDWKHHPEYQKGNEHYRTGGGIIPRPKTFTRMMEAARTLSKGFPQVRVDFYEINGKLFFGEMTMTSNCGRMVTFSDEYQKHAGNLVDLSLV